MKLESIDTKYGKLTGIRTPQGFLSVVPLEWVTVEPKAQRVFRETWASEIAGMWDDEKALPMRLRLIKGELFCSDGQHTKAAAETNGRTELVAVVLNGTGSIVDVANDFDDTNTNRRGVQPFDHYEVGITGKKPEALIVQKVCGELGLNPTRVPEDDDDIKAIGMLLAIARSQGEQVLHDTLAIASKITPSDRRRFNSNFLEPLAKAVQSQGEKKIRARLKKFGSFPASRLYDQAKKRTDNNYTLRKLILMELVI